MTTINNTNAQNVVSILRGLSEAKNKTENPQNAFIEAANLNAQDAKNKSTTTLLLEDYMEKYDGKLKGKSQSNITPEITQKSKFTKFLEFFGLGGRENIFETQEAQTYLKEVENFYQSDIFEQMSYADNGIKYADIQKDNISKAALNFAKADIAAIENTCIDYVGEGMSRRPSSTPHETNQKLDLNELDSYTTELEKEDFEKLDIDNKKGSFLNPNKTISQEEYASYMLLADGINGEMDGIISPEDIEAFLKLEDEDLAQKVEAIYKEYYK